MPPKSKAQQSAAGAALAAKRTGAPVKGKGPVAQMSKSMSTGQLSEFASGPTKGLPKKVGKPVVKRIVKT